MYCLLNILQCLVALASHLFLNRTEKMVVRGCQVRTVGRMWKGFPPKWFFSEVHSLQSKNVGPNGHKLFNNLSFESFLALHHVLLQVLQRCHSQWHVCSVEAVWGRPLRGSSWILLFPSLKCFIHRLKLVAPEQTSPYVQWSLRWISEANFSSLTRNSMRACCQKKTSLSAILEIIPVVKWYKVLHLKPNGAHSVSPLPRPSWIPPIPAAFMRAHGLAVCTPQYCTGHKHEQAIDSTATHFRVYMFF